MTQEVIRIDSPDDPRLAPYVRLKERDLVREGDRFIAEGKLVTLRLLQSPLRVESVLAAEPRLAEVAAHVPPGVPVYVGPHEMVNRIVGFKFHSGIMAVGVRPERRRLEDIPALGRPGPATLFVCPDLNNTDNLGAMVRIAAAFGVDGMVLGERSCDPFYRQSVRVSMGAVFHLSIVQSRDIRADLRRLREEFGFELGAAVLADDAEALAAARRGPRLGLLFGNESQGLAEDIVAICDRKLTIPMHLGIDSLNVSMSAAAFLFHFMQGAGAATPM